MSIEFDFDELRELAADLGDADKKLIPFVRKAVEVTARSVTDDWKKNAKRSSGVAKRYPSSIDYEMKFADGVIGAEVGPNLARPLGSFGLLEDAPGDVRSAPQYAGRKAAKDNEADFMKGLLQAGEDALK